MTLEVITHPHLAPLTHGFFTRRGGASSGVFAGLNCGRGSSDQAEIVAINRSRVAETMLVAPGALVTVDQVHSARAVVLSGPPAAPLPKADGLVTDRPGLVLGVLTADCQPVLFADADAGVIGAAHAGWKGALDGVLEATIEAMCGLGARRAAIAAVIGPTISQRNYEVGPEFRETFVAADPGHARFFVRGRGDRMLFDLPSFGLMRLRDAGIGRAEWTRHCTYADPDRFYSYRRSVHLKQADYGRLISTIRLSARGAAPPQSTLTRPGEIPK
jgi:YfiH family protein